MSSSATVDLASRSDIERLVDAFYRRVQADDLIGPIFNDIARVDWDTHLPRMYAFWDSVLFGVAGYKGNPAAVHRELAQHARLSQVEFDRWLELFGATVDELFAGPVAEHAKTRAASIATTLMHHVTSVHPLRVGRG